MATYTDTIGVSGVHGGSLYPNGGDYATIALWESTSGPSVSTGNVYEAVLLDGSAHDWNSGYPGWASTKDLDYEIVVRGDKSHEGYWTSADRGTSGGATITLSNNVSWTGFGDQNIKATFRDLVYSATTNRTMYYGNFNGTSGYSGDYSAEMTWDRCMFIHDEAAASAGTIGTFFNFRPAYESVDPSTGDVSAIGKFTLNLINCVFEDSYGFIWRQFPNSVAGEQNLELELNHIGCTWQESSNRASVGWFGRFASVDGSRNDKGLDSILRLNFSGCVGDKNPFLGGDLDFFASATKYCNMTDCLWGLTETQFRNGLGDNRTNYEKFIYTSSNITYSTSFGYTGASAANTVSFEETDVNSVERDYRQVAGSLGVDYVSNATMPSVDVTNTSRGTSPFTAGAYEFISATTDVTIDFGNTYIRVY